MRMIGELDYKPTRWQKKTLWAAITFLSLAVIATLAVLLFQVVNKVLGYLQPLLIPIAVAGVMAFLFEPLVLWLVAKKIPRIRAVILIFFAVTGLVVGLLTWLLPTIYIESQGFASRVPRYAHTLKERVQSLADKYLPSIQKFAPIFPKPASAPAATPKPEATPVAVPNPTPIPAAPLPTPEPTPIVLPTGAVIPAVALPVPQAGVPKPAASNEIDPLITNFLVWLQEQLPTITTKTWEFLRGSVGGFLGAFGFLLSLIMVPVYLFFFLSEAPKIASGWSDYLPLRTSAFKDEVVEVLSEINGYLINFFRGQLVVSLINGALTGIGLLLLGLDFALLIGLMAAILGLLPYLGILLCWVPAVIIAAVQWPGEWAHPIYVSLIFIGVQNIDGFFISPKIVGESVGLHPLTVIISVLVWSFMLGGLLGAILAVPLTATIKVLFRRYIWERRQPRSELGPPEPVEISAGGA